MHHRLVRQQAHQLHLRLVHQLRLPQVHRLVRLQVRLRVHQFRLRLVHLRAHPPHHLIDLQPVHQVHLRMFLHQRRLVQREDVTL